VLEHGRTGWLAKSADEMAELAIELLRCRQRLAQVSRAARRTWERRFTQARYHNELLSYFEELTKA
jgi:glycosyltransferase involved in cell wall biosynthesis